MLTVLYATVTKYVCATSSRMIVHVNTLLGYIFVPNNTFTSAH